MTNQKQSQLRTDTKQQKTFLAFCMRLIKKLNSLVIVEHRLRLFKGNSMFSLVFLILPFIPFKSQLIHNDNVITL